MLYVTIINFLVKEMILAVKDTEELCVKVVIMNKIIEKIIIIIARNVLQILR